MQRQWPSLNAFNTRSVQWEIGGSQEFCRTKINVMHSREMWKHRNIRSFLTVQFTSPRIIWIFQKWYNRTQVAGSSRKLGFLDHVFSSWFTFISDELDEKRNQWVISVSFSSSSVRQWRVLSWCLLTIYWQPVVWNGGTGTFYLVCAKKYSINYINVL